MGNEKGAGIRYQYKLLPGGKACSLRLEARSLYNLKKPRLPAVTFLPEPKNPVPEKIVLYLLTKQQHLAG